MRSASTSRILEPSPQGLISSKIYEHYILGNHFRFGITLGVKTMAPIQKDQEFFAPYGYKMDFAPKWYRELYKQFAKDNPTKVDKRQMQIIEYIDKKLAKLDIPLWDHEALKELFKEFRESKLPQTDE